MFASAWVGGMQVANVDGCTHRARQRYFFQARLVGLRSTLLPPRARKVGRHLVARLRRGGSRKALPVSGLHICNGVTGCAAFRKDLSSGRDAARHEGLTSGQTMYVPNTKEKTRQAATSSR
jgi:hypothetical protein